MARYAKDALEFLAILAGTAGIVFGCVAMLGVLP